jgi:hypothetical protein
MLKANKFLRLGSWTTNANPSNDASVYRFIVVGGSKENDNAALARTVLSKDVPAGCDVVVKFHSVKSEELAPSVGTVC